jgi:hypothetical protein
MEYMINLLNNLTNEMKEGKKPIEIVTSLLGRVEKCSERYIENEQFISDLLKMPLWKRIFLFRKTILDHLDKILKKYDF